MKPRVFFITSALIVVLLAACAPQATQAPAPIVANPPQAAAQEPETVVAQPLATEAAVQSDPVAVATSRGDALEATDPATVSLASGSLQLVEFFRYT